jgi:hypothetical protein
MAGAGKSLATRTDLLLEHRFGATTGQSPTWGRFVQLKWGPCIRRAEVR